jgi:hypothetical protein
MVENVTNFKETDEVKLERIRYQKIRKETYNDLLALADSFNSDVSKHLKNARAFKIDDIMKPLILAVSQFQTELEFRALLFDFQL